MIIMWFSTVFTIIFCLTTSTLTNSMVMHKGYGNGGESVSSSTTGTVSAQLKAKVAATIDQWLNDINTVNNFVDTVGKVPDSEQISCMASEAFVAAQNEGTSNTDLQNDVTLDASGQAAAKALLGQFNIIGPAINDTIFNPGNLQKNLDAINGARYGYLILPGCLSGGIIHAKPFTLQMPSPPRQRRHLPRGCCPSCSCLSCWHNRSSSCNASRLYCCRGGNTLKTVATHIPSIVVRGEGDGELQAIILV